MYTKIENKQEAWEKGIGTSLSGYLTDVTYYALVQVFGEPTLPNPSPDNKVQKEWVFEDEYGNIFTIYDWRTFDLDRTMNELTTWNVGSKVDASLFIQWIQHKLDSYAFPSLQPQFQQLKDPITSLSEIDLDKQYLVHIQEYERFTTGLSTMFTMKGSQVRSFLQQQRQDQLDEGEQWTDQMLEIHCFTGDGDDLYEVYELPI